MSIHAQPAGRRALALAAGYRKLGVNARADLAAELAS
jgi:hypothetical protein